MKVKAKIATAILKVSMFSAKKSCGAASMFGYHQPKEPEALKRLSK